MKERLITSEQSVGRSATVASGLRQLQSSDAERNCVSADPAVRSAGLDHLKWAIDCLAAAGGETLCGPFYQPLGVFTGEPPTKAERANVVSVRQKPPPLMRGDNSKLAVEPLNRFECYVLQYGRGFRRRRPTSERTQLRPFVRTFHANIEEKDPSG